MSREIYLAGEIHSDWRAQIIGLAEEQGLPFSFTMPETDHDASDAAGDMLGNQASPFWRDHQSAKVNAIKTRTLIQRAELTIIRFGDKYRQWNAAFDAGYCAAIGRPYITLHDASLTHALKEVDAAAMAWTQDVNQVLAILTYIA